MLDLVAFLGGKTSAGKVLEAARVFLFSSGSGKTLPLIPRPIQPHGSEGTGLLGRSQLLHPYGVHRDYRLLPAQNQHPIYVHTPHEEQMYGSPVPVNQ